MKKRLVATAIFMLVISLFFCTSVFADNIVIQGESDTVTATYGNNDVTVALRARKLRVINTGTAAAGYAGYTPVIVSITIYNLGDQNCLVNNLKFRLTSESAEYRIAGYENISPDLFISDTAYDATGYLSIKASNDYTYAGGFVVPANSNMTYVGIINVSANWITENQTWRTVDLSTATFYDNMTTTVGNYPCAADPVDLSGIENDLDSIINTINGLDLDVSTYLPILRDIYNSVAYNGSSVIVDSTYTSSYRNSNFSGNGLAISLQRIVYRDYVSDSSVALNATSDSIITSVTHTIPVLINIATVGSTAYEVPYNFIIDNIMPGNYVYELVDYYSDVFEVMTYDSRILLRTQKMKTNSIGYIPKGRSNSWFLFNIHIADGSSVTYGNFDISTIYTSPYPKSVNDYVPRNLYEIVRDIFLSLNPESTTNDPDDVNTESQSINNAVENIQTAEAQYFADNQEAIENTGLSNFHFNDNQIWSLTMIVDQFEAVWNALGEFTVVYIFTLMMSLATYLIRHEPTTKVKQWRESVSAERAERTSYYGRKNAEARAHGSTMKKAIRRR